MLPFRTPVDIVNRALDHCGQDPIDGTLGFSEQSKKARICARVYDKIRRAELRRNVWQFTIRQVVLRTIDASTMFLAPSLWSQVTTYFVGSIVADDQGTLWISAIPNNLNNDPQNTTFWVQYFGPLTVSLWVSTTTYFLGEVVYIPVGDGTYRVYLSLANANADNPATATAWSATATYSQNQTVTYLSVVYQSLVDLNINQQPNTHPSQWTTTFVGGTGSLKWLQIGGPEFPMGVALTPPSLIYPIGTGPTTQSMARNIYRLPAGYLRSTSSDPRGGSTSALGAPTNRPYDDYLFQGNYITSSQVDPMMLRFVSDVVDVTTFNDMFCEGLGARIGLEICEPLTQSGDKLKTIASIYDKFMGEARTVNAIEIGSEYPPLDDYIAVRF